MRHLLICAAAACLLQACGGGTSAVDGSVFGRARAQVIDGCRSTMNPAAAPLCPTAAHGRVAPRPVRAAALDQGALFAWAQQTYPQFFAGATQDGVYDVYTYRYFADTRSYIGIAGSNVYVLGPVSGGQIMYVGTLDEFACRIAPGSCSGGVRPENDDFSSAAIDTCRWVEWHQSGGTSVQGDGLRLQTSATSAFSAARRVSQYAVKDAQLEIGVEAVQGFDAIPDSAQLYASFGIMADDDNRFFISLAKAGGNTVIHAMRVSSTDGTQQFQNFPDIPIATRSVRLRITQSGATAVLEYDPGTGWATAATVPALPGGYVELTATNVGVARQFAATFSGFTIDSGATTWHAYVRGAQQRRTDFMAGTTGGDSMDFRVWGTAWGNVNPFQVMKASGMDWFASDVTFVSASDLAATPQSQWGSLAFQSSDWRSRELVAATLQDAAAAGLRLYVQLFLSDVAAHGTLQQAPAAWAGLSVADTASQVRSASFAVASDFKARGLNVEVYSIGNEIELGILNFVPGQRIPLMPGVSSLDLNYLRTAVWPTEATLLQAAIDGVKAANPDAKIVLHISGLGIPLPSDIFVKAFFRFMAERGVTFDYAGLSHPYANYPWRLNEYTTDCWMQRIQETSDTIAALGKKTMIVEGSYPRLPGASFSPPMTEFPYSDAGQAGWVREQLRHGNNNPNMAGFLYFYADYFMGMGNDASIVESLQYPGLFYPSLSPTPAMLEFGLGPVVTP
jgi:arabinogalactan endo-1,4-beta-galactosidase